MKYTDLINFEKFNRISLKFKLAAVFALSLFATVFSGLLLVSAQKALATESNDGAAQVSAPQIYEEIPADAEVKIEKALFPTDENDAPNAIFNPFRTSSKDSAMPNTTMPKIPGQLTSPEQVAAPNPANPSAPSQTPPLAAPAIADDLADRLKDYQKALRSGAASNREKSSVYRLDEIQPIGISGSAKRGQVVIFYIARSKDTVFAALGTRFRDGKLESVTTDGVNLQNSNGEIVFKRWSRLKSEKVAAPSSGAPVQSAQGIKIPPRPAS